MARDPLSFSAPDEKVTIDLQSIVAIVEVGKSITVYTTGGPVSLPPAVAGTVQAEWKKLLAGQRG